MAKRQNLDFNKLVPSSLKNETLSSLVSNVFNRFVSEEHSVSVDGRIGLPAVGDASIQASSLDRELNALVPAVNYKIGTEESLFTFNDFTNKLVTLDTDVANMNEWMSEQTFNYTPPISYDKLINFQNYYWAGTGVGPSWNKTLSPEFYVIERPAYDSTIKMPVKLATTGNINLYANDRPPETFTILFTSLNTFSVTSNGNGTISSSTNSLASIIAGERTQVFLTVGGLNLCSFYIENGTHHFSAGDYFTLKITYFTSEIYISLMAPNLVGKGALVSVQTTSTFMSIDGIQVSEGDRILVWAQTNAAENGIYRVHVSQKWIRTPDAMLETNLAVGTKIYVLRGVSHQSKTFELMSKVSHGAMPNNAVNSDLTFAALSGHQPIQVNGWQLANYWYHRDDLASIGLDFNLAIQANRPIIEYNSTLQLNAAVDSHGIPTDVGYGSFSQSKMRFNQIPQFDLFRYDGTHQGSTSGIFFYVEDPDFTTDAVLKKRVKLTADYDYVFGVGVADDANRLLYFKVNGVLTSIWQPGPAAPIASSIEFIGGFDKGNLTIAGLNITADNQDWTVTAISPTTFSVVGTRSGNVGAATVGTSFTCDDLVLHISAGTVAYLVGEKFKFSVHAPAAPRYVKKLANASIVNYPGGMSGDASDGKIDGTWLTPLRMFQNLERETRYEVAYGDLLDHFRSVIRHQDGFTGISIGNNNVRTLDFNPGLGGTIREFGSNFPLLASMLIQRDASPLTIIDFIEQQNIIALASIDQFMSNDLIAYLSNGGFLTSSSIDANAADVQSLLTYFCQLRSLDKNLQDTFGDTFAKIANWPTTIPMIGLKPKVLPTIGIDPELSMHVIVHHDGHISPLAFRDINSDRQLTRTVVLRSNGTETPGIFANTAPSTPYAKQLWFNSSTNELSVFNVDTDTDAPKYDGSQTFWYKRSVNQLYEWDVSAGVWLLSTSTVNSRWTIIDTAAIRNSLLLAVENELYNSVHPAQQQNLDLHSVYNPLYAEIELAKYAAKYNYDTYAPNFKMADPFTWNYKTATGVAKWFNIYKAYFNVPGSILPTDRPDLEPWKLLNFSAKPSTWDTMYASHYSPGTMASNVKVVATSPVSLLFGLQTIDGVALSNGDRVLLTAQTLVQFNGIYVVSNAGWSRSADVISSHTTVTATSGYLLANTVWVNSNVGPIIIGSTPLVFNQVRTWSNQMWADIKLARPSVKLCVNTHTDALLAPYVSSTLFASNEALLTHMPANIANGYVFGDDGPTELVWKKSLEYVYGLVRSYFRIKPLEFLDKSWGETYFHVNGNVRVERNLMTPLPASKFLMHGDKLNVINTYTAQETSQRVKVLSGGSISWTKAGTVTFEVTHCADDRTVFFAYINGQLQGMIDEGVSFDLPAIDGIDLTNVVIDDLGIPFELGEKIIITFYNDIIDPTYVAPIVPVIDLGCEGCVADGAATVVNTVPMVQVAPSFNHVPATAKKFKGLGQWFANLLRFSYIDTDVSPSIIAYSGWSLKLAHRVGSLIRPDSLTIDTVQGNLPPTSYSIVLKRSTNTDSKWISALRIQLVQMGTKRLNPLGSYIPVGNADDWIFRVEAYNPQHPLVEYYSLNTGEWITPTDFIDGPNQTFYALSKQRTSIAWKRYTEKVSLLQTAMPVSINGLQATLDFIYGYVDRLEEQGWKVNIDDSPTVDAETGRNLDWQLEIEKLIDRTYGGMDVGQGHILNPFMQKMYLQTPIGLMSHYTESNFIDAYSMQAAYDVTGKVIPISNLTIIRTDEETVTYGATPIFSAHVFIDEYEHTILFNKKFADMDTTSATIFDPFLGLRIDTAYLNYTRQDAIDRKPTFDGFFLSNSDVKRNIVSSIDSIGKYYDASQTFSEPAAADHALALLGFTKKDYFTNISANSTTQFNFWRGLIQAKGTNMTIDAFVNYKKFVDASVDEFWAYKVAEFGDARERTFPEIKINTSDATQKFAKLQFYSVNDANYNPLPLFTQIENSDATRWYSIDDLGKGMHFEAQHITETVSVAIGTELPVYVRLNNIFHNGDSNGPTVAPTNGCVIINASLVKVTVPGTYTISGYTWINPSKLSPIKLFDYQQNTLVTEIGLWHPAIGIHANEPLATVNMITTADPAHYNYSTQTTDNVNYQYLKPWGDREIARTWWDTSNLAYIPYYDAAIFPSIDARHSRWGALAEWATVDLYDWTESDVHPTAFDALAASEEGQADIDKSIRKSGKAALKKYYKRERTVKMRPIAWSHAGVGNANAHPAFGSQEFIKVFAAGNLLIADTSRLADLNIINGRNFGGWLANKPVGEVQIGTNISYVIGTSVIVEPAFFDIPISSLINSVRVVVTPNTFSGPRIGAIILNKKWLIDGTCVLCMSDATGFFEDKVLDDWFSNDTAVEATKTYKFDTFGLEIVITRKVGISSACATIKYEEIIDALTSSLNDIFVREAVDCTELLPLPDSVFVNDLTDPAYANLDTFEWRTWVIPTQAELDSDMASPRNIWLPYLGDECIIAVTPAIISAMNSSNFVLRSGININRFSSTWSGWNVLSSTKLETISNGVAQVSFMMVDTIDATRLSVYANGVQLNPASYVITGKLVQVVNTLSEGTAVLLLYRAYQPTTDELAFNPDIKDDVAIQEQFKADYQYTKLDIRDADGNISGTKYYFWVQDKTIVVKDKNMSLTQAKSLLKGGPTVYTIFSRLQSVPTIRDTYAASYDSCAIAGLGAIVSKNDSYKLRFLRNFTLRDDPEEMSLKNVHTEWALIRKQQSSKIPQNLWNALTNAICGNDIGGNPVPAKTRVDYDKQNNTRTRYGLSAGQIFADTALVKDTVINTILNTQLMLNLSARSIPDYITALNLDESAKWFSTPEVARITMTLIWNTARPSQINEIFFNVLDDALASNYEFGDIFKTSFITVSSTTQVTEVAQQEQADERY